MRSKGRLSVQLAERLITGVLSVAVGAAVARHLGPEAFGQLAFAIALVSMLATLAAFGLESVVMRDLVAAPERRSMLMSSALTLRGMTGMAAMLLVPIAAWALSSGRSGAQYAIVLAVGALPLLQSAELFDWYFLADRQPWRFAVPKVLASFVAAALRILLIFLNAPLLLFAAMVPGEWLARWLASGWAYAASPSRPAWQPPSREEIGRLVGECWPLALAGLSIMFYMRVDQLMIGVMLQAEAVGLYSAALTISEVFYVLPTVVARTFAPALTQSRLVQGDQEELLLRILRATTAVHLAVAVVVSFAAAPVMQLLFGPGYLAAAPVLRIHIWTGVFVSMGVLSNLWLVNEGLQKFALVRTLVGGMVNVLLNLVLIPWKGPAGAAVATLVSQIVAAWLLDLASPQTRRMFDLKWRALLWRSAP